MSVRFQGDPAAFTTLPCQFFIPRNSWVTAFYFQTHPLPPDVYTATIALTPSGGPTTVLSQSVTVIQHG